MVKISAYRFERYGVGCEASGSEAATAHDAVRWLA